MSETLWFAGVCDSLLAKCERWLSGYETGEVSRTRPFMDERTCAVIDKPVQFAHRIAWHPREIDYLVKIMEAAKPDAALTIDLRVVQRGLKRTRQLPGGLYLATMVFWRDDVDEIVKALRSAKAGKLSGVNEYVEAQTGQGGGLWKV